MKRMIAYIWAVVLTLLSMSVMAEGLVAAATDEKINSWAVYVCVFSIIAFILGVGFGLYETLLDKKEMSKE